MDSAARPALSADMKPRAARKARVDRASPSIAGGVESIEHEVVTARLGLRNKKSGRRPETIQLQEEQTNPMNLNKMCNLCPLGISGIVTSLKVL